MHPVSVGCMPTTQTSAQAHTQPSTDLPTIDTLRWQAEFIPQVWVDDEAVDIDTDGPHLWDATAYAATHLDYLARITARSARRLDIETIDNDDVFAADPTAPAIVHTHTGPFTILLTATEDGIPVSTYDLAAILDR